MSKLKDITLAAFLKANKVAREKMAKLRGFNGAASMEASLRNPKPSGNITKVDSSGNKRTTLKHIVKTPKKGVISGAIPVIHNIHILDASYSMHGGKFNNALAGINNEIATLKGDNSVEYTQTVISFSSKGDIVRHYYMTPIKDVNKIVAQVRNNTSLYQTVGEVLQAFIDNANGTDKYLIKIFTDGEDNDSHGSKYLTYGVLRDLIKNAETRGFTIAFQGTAQDIANVKNFLNLDASNMMIHDNTARGVEMSFMNSTISTQTYSKNVKLGKDVTRGFYKEKGTL